MTQEHFSVQLACFDVEKPDLIRFYENEKWSVEDIYAPLPVIDILKCSYCGACTEYCPENALLFNRYVPSVTLIVSACVACGKCRKGCGHNGIRMTEKLAGRITTCLLENHSFLGGQINAMLEFKMPLINALLERLKQESTTICDFEPGTENAVKLALSHMDIAVVVLPPDARWELNLCKILDMIAGSNIVPCVILNKVINDTMIVRGIKAYLQKISVPLIGIIPFIEKMEYNPDAEIVGSALMLNREFVKTWKELTNLVPDLLPGKKGTLK